MMGACEFECETIAKTADAAFNKVLEQALYDHGHAGYTGTIAEKSGFEVLPFDPATDKLDDFISKHIEENDKWGDAFCVQIPLKDKPGYSRFVFFGWASS